MFAFIPFVNNVLFLSSYLKLEGIKEFGSYSCRSSLFSLFLL